MFNATRFKTLMRREWLQNRWTWLIAVGALPALVLLLLPFGDVRLPDARPLTMVAASVIAIAAMVCGSIAWATTLFTATSLGRRDVQDRSIEFWLSLPSTHVENIGAQYLMHAFVFPLGAVIGGSMAGAVLAPLVLLKWQGLAAVTGAGWGAVLAGVAVPLLLVVPATLLLALWLSPVVLGLMALSAWFKRLALPLVAVATIFLANLPLTQSTVRTFAEDYANRTGFLVEGLVRVFVTGLMPSARVDGEAVGPLAAKDYLLEALNDLVSTPHFALGLAMALVASWALIQRRKRGG